MRRAVLRHAVTAPFPVRCRRTSGHRTAEVTMTHALTDALTDALTRTQDRAQDQGSGSGLMTTTEATGCP
ncbi:hypothetical protein GCM10017744_058640 [Streptomyces antimycoticus]|uniref:Uncharacterized protein n=1 Tax=Streptomyces antimycoticus TaxID=68175 RepID=A0A4D4KAW6_9ACTN|nr:hypothetical protein SANT12839_043590 [Streptomyces antimycoticus]